MEYDRQRRYMLAAGFSEVRQIVRLSELALFDISKNKGAKQDEHLKGLISNTVHHGSSSIVIAVKIGCEATNCRARDSNAASASFAREVVRAATAKNES
jgi:hypothetical protein